MACSVACGCCCSVIPGGSGQPFGFSVVAGVAAVAVVAGTAAAVGRGFDVSTVWRTRYYCCCLQRRERKK